MPNYNIIGALKLIRDIQKCKCIVYQVNSVRVYIHVPVHAHYSFHLSKTSARLASLARRQAAQAAFRALVRRNGASTYSPSHTEFPTDQAPQSTFLLTNSPGPGTLIYSPSITDSLGPGAPTNSPSLTE